MAQRTDQERVAGALGVDADGTSRDLGGERGFISTQFIAALKQSRTSLDEIIKFDKDKFEGIVNEIVQKIETYALLKPMAYALLTTLDPEDPGTLAFFLFSVNFFFCFCFVFLQIIG